MRFRFTEYELDTQRYQLLSGGKRVELRPKALDLLVYLVERADQVVSKSELLEHLWPGRDEVVNDAMLNTLVMQVRQAIGDDGTEQRIIQTRRGRGYCFKAPVEIIPETIPSTSGDNPVNSRPVTSVKLDAERPDMRRSPWFFGVSALVGLLFVSVVVYFYISHVSSDRMVASEDNMDYPLPELPSIIVLPFANLSDDSKQDFFVDGVSESIITALAKIPSLFVIASDSAFTYKGKAVAVKQVAEEMGVRYVLKGSVQRSAGRVRLTAQLIDALSGHHLWGDDYDRELQDLFALQDDITWQIATELEVNLLEGEEARVKRHETTNVEAYELHLQATELGLRFNRLDNNAAIRLYEQALELDPQFASAWVGLGWRYRDMGFDGWSDDDKAYAKATEMAQKALAINPSHAEAYALLAGIHADLGNHEQALAFAEKGVTLAPNHAVNLGLLAIRLASSGNRPQEALVVIKKAMRLSPRYPAWMENVLGKIHYYLEDYDQAIAAYAKNRDRNPDAPSAYADLAMAYAGAGRLDEARTEAEKLLALAPNFTITQNIPLELNRDPSIRKRIVDDLRAAGLPVK